MSAELTQEYLHTLFKCKDGELYWRTPRKGVKIGVPAGGIVAHGRGNNIMAKRISIFRKRYYNSQIIFMMEYGYMPDCVLHIDSNRLNNRIENLRAADKSDNKCFSSTPSNNTSGLKGVSWNNIRNKWQVTIAKDYKTYHLGYYDDPLEAHAVYCKKAKELHGKFAKFH